MGLNDRDRSKPLTPDKKVYFAIFSYLRSSSNLVNLKNSLKISKQNLNKYLRKMEKKGLIIHKSRGHYEVVNRSKPLTKYGSKEVNLLKDSIRGHAYIWSVKLPQEIEGWKDRLEILNKKGINFKLVGVMKIPRIKVLGRKVWLCNDHLRIFDKEGSSYYGKTAKEAKELSFNEVLLILDALEKKLGVLFKIKDIYYKKEHYALIKNDLAIKHNREGEIVRISDKEGEWLLIDDSLEQGGELENVGKKSFKTNLEMANWWNDHKKHNFGFTPSAFLDWRDGTTKIINQNIEHIAKLSVEVYQIVDFLNKNFKDRNI